MMSIKIVGVVVLLVVVMDTTTADDCNMWNTDMWWGDIYSFRASDFEECKKVCREHSVCVGVVFYYKGLFKNKCFLKDRGHGRLRSCHKCRAAIDPCLSNEGPCPAGQYKVGSTECVVCSANTYSAAGSTSCTACPDGSYSAAGSTSCSLCPAGKYSSSGGSCEICPVNTYSAQGSGFCTACPDGTTTDGMTGSSSADACIACPDGSHLVEGSCSLCPAGKYSSSGGSCEICPVNTYSAQGSRFCTACPDGTVTDEIGSASVDACRPVEPKVCWDYRDLSRINVQYGPKMTIENAKKACLRNKKCTGVSCHRKHSDWCRTGTGKDIVDARKYFAYLRECD